MKTILFLGVFTEEYSNNIPQVEMLRKRGYKVDTCDYREIAQSMRITTADKKYDFFTRILRQTFFPQCIRKLYWNEKGRKHLQKELTILSKKNYDIVFISKGEEIHPTTVEEFAKNSKVFYYFMDPIGTAKTIEADKLAALSHYASATTSTSQKYFQQRGARVALIPQGINPETYKNLPMKKTIDVIFVGSITGKRKRFVQAIQNAGISIAVYGPNTKNGPLYLRKLMETYAQSKIILNFVREEGGFSVRVYQAMATGSLVLTEYCLDLKNYFKRKQHIDWFSSPDECISLIKYYLKNENKREIIAKNGKELVFKKYTWNDQITRILTFIDE